uniref:Uncharacterized protein n=1 Tax=Panagrolaimus sp. JU765 TaxID=591449 RepID=A0AC34Q7U2_9BILA
MEEKNQILNDLRKEKEKLDLATKSYNNSDEPQDYVTMKPIHKIKPFTFNDKNDGFKDIDEDSDGNSKVLQPPPLPIHRTIPKSDSIQSKQSTTNKTNTPTTKLYDNPNDDTLSNVTSNGLDD